MNDSFDQEEHLRSVLEGFRHRGVQRLFAKQLAQNDNDKNQIYLSTNLDGIAHTLRARRVERSGSASTTKPSSVPGRSKMAAHLDWIWISLNGDVVAPNTKLIYYFQYPEVRLSGFLSGCSEPPDALRRRRLDHYGERTLLFGTDGVRVFGDVIAGPPGTKYPTLPGSYPSPLAPGLTEIRLGRDEPTETRIQRLIGPWHQCVRLRDLSEGPIPFHAPQRAGYTLEALLGIPTNASSGPDLGGSELKAFRFSKKVTLMTPAPDGGREKTLGMRRFLETHGREGRDGESVRFTGTYRVGSSTQGRTLVLEGAGGHILESTGVALIDSESSVVLARWSQNHLSSHWLAKHDSAFYVDYEPHPTENMVRFCGYFRCRGTSPERLLNGIASGTVYYDPAHTLKHDQLKIRPQWRISTARRTLTNSLNSLYRSVDRIG